MLAESLLGDDADVLYQRKFQALLLTNLLAPLGVTLLSPILSSLTGPFQVPSTQVGLLIAAYTAPPIVLIPVAGVLADRYGRKPVLLSGILLFGLGGTGIAFTTDFRMAVGLRLLQGVGFAGLTPIIITSLGDFYFGTREATAQGVRFMSSGIYQAVFPPIAGLIVGIAWQFPFLIYASAFPIALVVYLWFDEPLDRSLAESEQTPGDGGDDAGEGPAPNRGGQLRPLVRLTIRRRVLALVVGRCLPMIIWVGFLTYISVIVVRTGIGTAAEAGVIVAIHSVMLAVGGSQAGRINELFDSRLWPLVVSNFVLGGGLVLVAVSGSVPIAAVGSAILGLGFGVLLSLYRTIVTGLAPATLRAGLVSVAESGGRIASTATPIGMGVLVTVLAPELGFEAAVRWTAIGVAVVVTAGGLICLAVARLSPKVPAERTAVGRTG